jgi:NAD-dependent DNA ligase
MNFDCVGKDSKGQMYMKFHKPFNIVEKMQLLQRSILVNSYAYYELNDNIISDFQYDANARQLEELAMAHPEEFKRSRYYAYFHDFYDSDEHATSGYALLERLKKNDIDLYNRIQNDAFLALKLSRKGM